jgi:sialate O-acetylesterase
MKTEIPIPAFSHIMARILKGVALALVSLKLVVATASGTVAVSPIYGSNMVLQRDKPVPVRGMATAGQTIAVSFNGQTTNATADAQGRWQVTLAPMSAKAVGGNFTITESGGNTLTFSNVVVGDVWLCSGQSNMAFGLGGCDRPADITSANFPGIRSFAVPLANLGEPANSLVGSWSVCSPSTAAEFSAVAFYFGRKLYQDQTNNVPIGLVVSSVGGTCIDPWLAPEGGTDIPVLAPLYSQPILAWGPFSLFNGMIYPLAHYPMKGAIWYQGENRETTSQSTDSYFLKEKALASGWKRVLGMDDFALYVVQLANWLDPATTATPDGLGSWADTRQMQTMALAIPHGGMASALDVGDAADIHPKDKLDVGERLALWALKNDYGRTNLVPCGPVLRDVGISGTHLVCSFDFVGAGLMVGAKTPYLPTQETNVPLARFVIAGSGGTWYAANATISNNTVIVSSPSVAVPRQVAYAYWTNPSGANLYNRDGLPAAPFFVDDVTVKYTVSASAGAGGSIGPSGVNTYLRRATALYTITPDAGNCVQDVKVDGASVGAVRYFTFDPLYTNHTITATFTNTQPGYAINATAGPGGSLSPSGTVAVAQGGRQAFAVKPTPGSLTSIIVDGRPMGSRQSFTFVDARTNHTIAASFSFTIQASSGYGGSITSPGVTVLPYGSNQTYTITPASSYAILKVMVDGANVGAVSSFSFTNVTTNHTISASFSGGSGSGSVPQQGQLLFSCLVDSLPASGSISSWPGFIPSSPALSTIGSPTVATIDSRKYALNYYYDGDGFNQGSYSLPIPCAGASIVVVAKPVRNGVSAGWTSIVDAFYDRLVLGIRNDNGQVCVRRNGSVDTSALAIPDGQTTILSLIVQANGSYKVWANGSPIHTNNTSSSMLGLTNGVAGSFANNVTVGRNWPDGWTTFNGYVGDVFFYKTALSDAERLALEQYLASRLVGTSGTNYTINASAGAGGTITPSGAVLVASNADQSFTITPIAGYLTASVLVDGAAKGPLATWTFTNVTANHTLSATFTNSGSTTYTISASAGAGGGISPTGAVLVNSNANQTFTISPNGGYQISDVLVDGISKGPITTWTFTNVTGSHTISVSFALVTSGIPRTSELLFSCATDTFPANGNTGPWATFLPAGQSLSIIGSPTVEVIDGVKWEKNVYANYTGYRQARYATSLACNGITIVAAVRPIYYSVGGEPRGEIVDIFYDRLALAVGHSDGRVMVARGSWNDWGPALSNGQKTILSLVVQTNGAYKAFANSTEIMTGGAYGDYTAIPPNHTNVWGAYTPWAADYDFTHYINVGRNEPDGWSTFNGNLGDVFVYKVALAEAERQQLEARLTARFILPPQPTLNIARHGSGGVEITWSDSFIGQLLFSPAVGSNASWTPVGGTPARSNGLYRVSVIQGSAVAYFVLGL